MGAGVLLISESCLHKIGKGFVILLQLKGIHPEEHPCRPVVEINAQRLPQQQRFDLAAESALESLRIVSARAEAMAGGATRQPLPRTGPQPSTTTPRAAMLDLHKRREIETVLEDLEQALTQLRSTLKAQN